MWARRMAPKIWDLMSRRSFSISCSQALTRSRSVWPSTGQPEPTMGKFSFFTAALISFYGASTSGRITVRSLRER